MRYSPSESTIWWPDLKDTLDKLPEEPTDSAGPSQESKLDEVLETVRELSRRTSIESEENHFLRTEVAHLETQARVAEMQAAWLSARRAVSEEPRRRERDLQQIEQYEVVTDGAVFGVEILEDTQQGLFVGRLINHGPAELPPIEPGKPYPISASTPWFETSSRDKNELIQVILAIIKQLKGRIESMTRVE